MADITLKPERLAELAVIIGDMPHKHAVRIIGFLQRVAREQAPAALPKRVRRKEAVARLQREEPQTRLRAARSSSPAPSSTGSEDRRIGAVGGTK